MSVCFVLFCCTNLNIFVIKLTPLILSYPNDQGLLIILICVGGVMYVFMCVYLLFICVFVCVLLLNSDLVFLSIL